MRAISATQRCTNPKDRRYADYGGRGVQFVFESPTSMGLWVMEHLGLQPEMQIDRINNEGPYGPGNLRWATREENQQNTRKQRRRTGASTTS